MPSLSPNKKDWCSNNKFYIAFDINTRKPAYCSPTCQFCVDDENILYQITRTKGKYNLLVWGDASEYGYTREGFEGFITVRNPFGTLKG